MKIYYIVDELEIIVSFHTTKKAAKNDFDLWLADGQEVDLRSIEFNPSRKGFVEVLNKFRQG